MLVMQLERRTFPSLYIYISLVETNKKKFGHWSMREPLKCRENKDTFTVGEHEIMQGW